MRRPSLMVSYLLVGMTTIFATVDAARGVDNLSMIVAPGSEVANIGETVTVFLGVSSLTDPINGIQARLHYDTTLLRLDSLLPNDLVASGLVTPPAAGWMEVSFSETAGDVDWAALVTAGSIGSNHIVATLTFTVLAEGATTIDFRPDTPPFETRLTRFADSLVVSPNVLNSGTILLGLPAVNLSLVPAAQTVQVGQTVRVDLVAAPATALTPSIGSIDAILNWTPGLIELLGRVDTGPIAWSFSGFPNDAALDDLNGTFADGDALYQALADFVIGVPIPSAGIVITSFDFLALNGSVGTQVVIAPTGGAISRSRVLGAGTLAGVDLTGTLGAATIQIVECSVGGDCDDGNACTDDACVGGVCQFTNNTGPCDDGLFCTDLDFCSGGTCISGTSPCLPPQLCSETLNACVECLSNTDCDDGNGCTDNVCDATGSCQFPNNTAACDDGIFCTFVDVCSGGVCVGAGDTCPGQLCDEAGNQCVDCLDVTDCDDGNICTDDACVANVCQHTANSAPCDDNLFCTATDVCVSGACVGLGDPCPLPSLCSETFDACVQCLEDLDCDDGNLCTTDTCLFGTCSSVNNTLPCDDGLFCTATDVCSGGACFGSGDPCPVGELCDEPNAQCVECFTVADCADDLIACTEDACVGGVCVYPTNDTLCDDGAFCNGPETCSGVSGCQPGVSPCDDPTLCDEATDSCGCQPPVVAAEGSRYFSVTPRPGATPLALRVIGVDPEVACLLRYVQGDGTLGDVPVFKRPGGPTGWQTVHVHSVDVIPIATYRVRSECETAGGSDPSTPVTVTTLPWADIDVSGSIDVFDILIVLDGFQGVFEFATRYAVDLWGDFPEDCQPQGTVSLLDALKVVDAFQGLPFPCGIPCP